MKRIRELPGSYSSKVYLVEIGGNQYVHKISDADSVRAEIRFHDTLKKSGIAVLECFQNDECKENELIIEYVPGSKTLSDILSPEIYTQRGKTCADVHLIQSDTCIINDGKFTDIYHNDFIQGGLDFAIARRKERGSDLSQIQIDKIFDICMTLKDIPPLSYSYIHGDMHQNNVLVKGDPKNVDICLFDVQGYVIYADPCWDISLISISLPNGYLIDIDDPKYAPDTKLLDAFFDGYGEDIRLTQSERLEKYVLLRAFMRYPNPFEIHLKDMIEGILKRY